METVTSIDAVFKNIRKNANVSRVKIEVLVSTATVTDEIQQVFFVKFVNGVGVVEYS